MLIIEPIHLFPVYMDSTAPVLAKLIMMKSQFV